MHVCNANSMVLFLFCLALRFLLRGVSCWVLFCSLFSYFFSHVSIVIKRELVYVLLVHLFVYLARVNLCPFFLSRGVRFGCGL